MQAVKSEKNDAWAEKNQKIRYGNQMNSDLPSESLDTLDIPPGIPNGFTSGVLILQLDFRVDLPDFRTQNH